MGITVLHAIQFKGNLQGENKRRWDINILK